MCKCGKTNNLLDNQFLNRNCNVEKQTLRLNRKNLFFFIDQTKIDNEIYIVIVNKNIKEINKSPKNKNFERTH